MPFLPTALLLVAAALPSAPTQPQAPKPKLSDRLGITVPARSLQTGTAGAAQSLGVAWVRVVVPWGEAEKQRGVYDLSAWAAPLEELRRKHLKAILVLTGANPLYDGGQAPHTPEGRAAYAAFCGQAAKQLKARYLELWDEPNAASSWRPAPRADDYAALVADASRALRAVDKEAAIIAGGTLGTDLDFHRAAFAAGLLSSVDAVAVHWEAGVPPESSAAQLPALEAMVRQMRPVPPAVVSKTPRVGKDAPPPTPAKEYPLLVTAYRLPASGAGGEGGSVVTLIRALASAAATEASLFCWEPAEAGAALPDVASPTMAAWAKAQALLTGYEFFRRVELPSPLQGVSFRKGRREVTVFWSGSGDGSVDLRPKDDGAQVLDVQGRELKTLPKGDSSLALTESPVFVVGTVRVTGSRAG